MDRVEGLVSDRLAGTKAEYLKLIADRPPKFDARQVGYGPSKGGPSCSTCRHFFVSKVARRRVCEIFRPDHDSSVDPDYTCKFHTKDGVSFPLLNP